MKKTCLLFRSRSAFGLSPFEIAPRGLLRRSGAASGAPCLRTAPILSVPLRKQEQRFLSRAEKATFRVTFLFLRNTNTARGTESLFSAILTNAYFKMCAPSAERDRSRRGSDPRAWEVRCRTEYGVVCTFISRSVQPFGVLVR